MANKIATFIVLFLFQFSFAQINLVPNPSFEIDTACPNYSGEIFKAIPWLGTNGSTDYFKECGSSSAFRVPNNVRGFQNARTGKAYAGQYSFQTYGLNYREYLQSPLIESLVINKCYLVKFYVNNANNVRYGTNNHSALLSNNSFSTITAPWPIPSTLPNYTPQIISFINSVVKDTLDWIEIGGVYKASGGEKYITIGNFKPDTFTDTVNIGGFLSNMSYYFIDDVSVEEFTDTKKWIRDTTIHRGDSVFIGSNLGGISATWYNMAGQVIGSKPGLFVKPNIDTKYVVHQNFCGGNFIDTVLVQIIEDHVGISKLKIADYKLQIYPQPADEFLYLELYTLASTSSATPVIELVETTASKYHYSITNSFGQIIREQEVVFSNKKINISIKDLSEGIYLLNLKSNNSPTASKRFVIAR